jgi:hypothetical protein
MRNFSGLGNRESRVESPEPELSRARTGGFSGSRLWTLDSPLFFGFGFGCHRNRNGSVSGGIESISKNTPSSPGWNSPFVVTHCQPLIFTSSITSAFSMGTISKTR